MKVQNCSLENNNVAIAKKKQANVSQYHPSFKAGAGDGALILAGGIMQWIQDQGFLASFLIQDLLGMTAPRVGAAFLRDKEITLEEALKIIEAKK